MPVFAWLSLSISPPDWQLLSWIIREAGTSTAALTCHLWLPSDASYSARSSVVVFCLISCIEPLPFLFPLSIDLESPLQVSFSGNFHFLSRWTKPSITLVPEILVPFFCWFWLFPDFSSSKNRSRMGNHQDKRVYVKTKVNLRLPMEKIHCKELANGEGLCCISWVGWRRAKSLARNYLE